MARELLQISSEVSARVLKRPHCPKREPKAGAFTLCLVAAITEWQPRASQGRPSEPQPLTSRNKLQCLFIIGFNSPMEGTKASIKTEQIFLTLGSEARD